MHALIEAAFAKWVTSVAAWLIALVLANGALVHVANILGYGKMPWGQSPIAWRVMDVLLLAFNVAVIYGLVRGRPWSVYLLYTGILLLQIVPYTLFRSHFANTPEDHATLNSLIGVELVLLTVFAGLIVWQGRGNGL